MILLFDGDSIVASTRNISDPHHLGEGFVARIAEALPQHEMICFARCGDDIADTYFRWNQYRHWQQPAHIVTFLVGLNSARRRKDPMLGLDADHWEHLYGELLTMVRERQAAKIVLCEPWIFRSHADYEGIEADLTEKRGRLRNLAEQYDALIVHFASMFADLEAEHEQSFLTPDTLHPSAQAKRMMANCWIQTLRNAHQI